MIELFNCGLLNLASVVLDEGDARTAEIFWHLAATVSLLLGTGLLWRRTKALEYSARVTDEEQIAKRLQEATGALGSKNKAEVIGAIYALEKIASDGELKNHWHVMELFSHYIRNVSRSKDTVLHFEEIQTIIKVIGRRSDKQITYEKKEDNSNGRVIDLSGANLKNYELVGDYQNVIFAGSQLRGADVRQARNLAIEDKRQLEEATGELPPLDAETFRSAALKKSYLWLHFLALAKVSLLLISITYSLHFFKIRDD